MREVRAELVSLGGGVVFAICMLFTMALVAMASGPLASTAQVIAMFLVMLAAWAYLCDSCMERLQVNHDVVELHAGIGRRTRRVSLMGVKRISLVHEGFNLEQGMESLQFERAGGEVIRLPIGPCWRQRTLQVFIRSVESVLI